MTAFDSTDYDTVLFKKVTSDGKSVTCEMVFNEPDENWDLFIWTDDTSRRHLRLSSEQADALVEILAVLFPTLDDGGEA